MAIAALKGRTVLVTGAASGIGYLGGFVSSPLESWRRVLDINVMGVVHGCRRLEFKERVE